MPSERKDLAAKCRTCGAFWAWQSASHSTPKERAKFAAEIVKRDNRILVEVTTEESRAGKWECDCDPKHRKPDAEQVAFL